MSESEDVVNTGAMDVVDKHTDEADTDPSTAIRSAQSLGSLRDALLEASGDFGDSPFPQGTQHQIEVVKQLQREAERGVPWERSTANRLEFSEEALCHVRELYESATSGEDDFIVADY